MMNGRHLAEKDAQWFVQEEATPPSVSLRTVTAVDVLWCVSEACLFVSVLGYIHVLYENRFQLGAVWMPVLAIHVLALIKSCGQLSRSKLKFLRVYRKFRLFELLVYSASMLTFLLWLIWEYIRIDEKYPREDRAAKKSLNSVFTLISVCSLIFGIALSWMQCQFSLGLSHAEIELSLLSDQRAATHKSFA